MVLKAPRVLSCADGPIFCSCLLRYAGRLEWQKYDVYTMQTRLRTVTMPGYAVCSHTLGNFREHFKNPYCFRKRRRIIDSILEFFQKLHQIPAAVFSSSEFISWDQILWISLPFMDPSLHMSSPDIIYRLDEVLAVSHLAKNHEHIAIETEAEEGTTTI